MVYVNIHESSPLSLPPPPPLWTNKFQCRCFTTTEFVYVSFPFKWPNKPTLKLPITMRVYLRLYLCVVVVVVVCETWLISIDQGDHYRVQSGHCCCTQKCAHTLWTARSTTTTTTPTTTTTIDFNERVSERQLVCASVFACVWLCKWQATRARVCSTEPSR